MPGNLGYKRRWLVLPDIAHLVHEHDAPFTRTMCGQVFKVGVVEVAERRKYKVRCQRCEAEASRQRAAC
jgi:hypothetical protein